MGIVLIVGVMVLTGGLCRLFNYCNERSSRAPSRDGREPEPYRSTSPLVIPDRVPSEWIDAYRTDQGG